MKNKVYLSHRSVESLHSLDLSDAQTENVVRAIDGLEDGDPQTSEVVFADDSPGGGLRSISADGVQILFRYNPQDHSVLVADLAALKHDRTPVLA